jgi:predicted molibdopterin-dependent oxidoreductase YjgC
MGLAPDLLPGRAAPGVDALKGAWGEIPSRPGLDTREILGGLVAGDIRGLVLVGADPARDVPTPGLAEEALEAAEYVVAIDTFLNDSNRDADIILPASAFAEKDGTATNIEGRVQKLNSLKPAPGQARDDWSILDDIAISMGCPLGLSSAETISKEISEVAAAYDGVTWDYLEWNVRDGAVVPLEGKQPISHIPVALPGAKAPSAEFTLHVARTMYDDGVRLRHSPSSRGLAPGAVAHINPADAPRLGAKDGAHVRVVTSQGEGEFVVVLDEGTPSGVVYVPFNQPGGSALGTDPVVRVTAVSE